MATSRIEWTEQTWNPVTGCAKVSAGCKHCYCFTTPDARIKLKRLFDIELLQDFARMTRGLIAHVGSSKRSVNFK